MDFKCSYDKFNSLLSCVSIKSISVSTDSVISLLLLITCIFILIVNFCAHSQKLRRIVRIDRYRSDRNSHHDVARAAEAYELLGRQETV